MIDFNGLSYHLRTFGCQMNKHDSERVAGMLDALGALATDDVQAAEIVIFMTCCVREAADVRLLGQVASLGSLASRSSLASYDLPVSPSASHDPPASPPASHDLPASHSPLTSLDSSTSHRSPDLPTSSASHRSPDLPTSSAQAAPKSRARVIAVGGCIGQRDGSQLLQQLPHVGVVFGTHNIAHLPALLSAALEGLGPQVEVLEDEEAVEHAVSATPSSAPATPSAHLSMTDSAADPQSSRPRLAGVRVTDLPAHREQHWHAWLPIMTGCNNFCSYCVVPYVRGREHSRPFEEVVAEAERLVADGVREITLLGQNVNSYGRDLYGQSRFAEMLRTVGASGVERLRFATSHPKDLSEATIAAFAETPAVMPQLHLPVQSGSDPVLRAMNRNYTVEHYLGLVEAVRNACRASGKGEIALSTDIIVGFPHETEEDFEATLALVREAHYAQVFTFIYSRRQGTPAAALTDDTPRAVIQQRFDRLVALVQNSAWENNQAELATVVPVLFEGASKRDASVLAGRSPKNQTVHAPLPTGASVEQFAGHIGNVRIDEARTWYLRGELV